MNEKPINGASDADLRGTQLALERAALRARELAVSTGTAIVVMNNGIMEHIDPIHDGNVAQIMEPSLPDHGNET